MMLSARPLKRLTIRKIAPRAGSQVPLEHELRGHFKYDRIAVNARGMNLHAPRNVTRKGLVEH